MQKTTHFGFESVPIDEKAAKVAKIFDSVAGQYDLMNDLMSCGLHRLWKRFALETTKIKAGSYVLDLAAGTGDLARGWAKKVGAAGQVWVTDINFSMLSIGRDQLLDAGLILDFALADAECLPFQADYFDCVSVAFGLRNMTDQNTALAEIWRVLKPGGQVVILEFSKIYQALAPLYDLYLFKVLPLMGRWVAKDERSYRYLAESIRMHPDQNTLKQMLITAGFSQVGYHNLSGGIVALHKGYKC